VVVSGTEREGRRRSRFSPRLPPARLPARRTREAPHLFWPFVIAKFFTPLPRALSDVLLYAEALGICCCACWFGGRGGVCWWRESEGERRRARCRCRRRRRSRRRSRLFFLRPAPHASQLASTQHQQAPHDASQPCIQERTRLPVIASKSKRPFGNALRPLSWPTLLLHGPGDRVLTRPLAWRSSADPRARRRAPTPSLPAASPPAAAAAARARKRGAAGATPATRSPPPAPKIPHDTTPKRWRPPSRSQAH
jgi:hypothetical protein